MFYRFVAATALISVTSLAAPIAPRAAVIATLAPTGPDVSLTLAGSVDLSDTFFVGTLGGGSGVTFVNPTGGALQIKGSAAGFDEYLFLSPVAGPSSFGTGASTVATSSAGTSRFSLLRTIGYVWVPAGYTSNAALGSFTATFASTTLAGLGADPGTYVWTWSTATGTDSLTLNVVPEPNTMLLLATGLVLMSLRRRSAAAR